jgi:predicted DNA-binding ribbon-helix-helix protein
MTEPPLAKRSVTIAGHATSVSLEPEFWAVLRAIAAARGVSLNALVGEVDARRGARNLSSALRVHVLEALRRSAAEQ